MCTLPWRLRYAAGYDRKLCTDLLRVFIAAVRRFYRHRAKRGLGLSSVSAAKFGAVTMLQRSDSALRINPHFHTLAIDGVYVRAADGELQFHGLPDPTPEDVAEVAAWTYAGLLRVLRRHGRSLEGLDDVEDTLADESHRWSSP